MNALTKILTVIVVIFSISYCGFSEEWKNPKANIPPLAKPQRRSAGEGVPPLPLPATPIRRSEKKRQPSPPALIGMINFSDLSNKFPTTQIDIERLMSYSNIKLNIKYKFQSTNLDKFSFSPRELPILYITGWTALPDFSKNTINSIRRYIYDGGTVVFHAQCGRKEFRNSAVKEIRKIFPDRKLAPIDTDNYIYHSFFNIEQMRVREDDKDFKSIPPYLEVVFVGCRAGIIYSPIDLNCGWDVAKNPIQGGILYHQDDALCLGVNIITSCLANFQYAQSFGTEKIYHQQSEKSRDQLVIAQIAHDGDFDPCPASLPNLMKNIQKNTTLNVQFKREIIQIDNIDIFKHPVIYMTGLRDFALKENEIKQLRSYLKSGGMLLAESCIGNVAFDFAFKREIKKIFGEDLEELSSDSPLFQMPYNIKSVEYSKIAKVQDPLIQRPKILGMKYDGQLCVIYSQYGLSSGWEDLGFAYNNGIESQDAIRLGINILSFCLTH